MQGERHHLLSMMKNKRTDPVTVVFGRPDICVYLRETFAKDAGAPAARGESGQDIATPLVDTTASTRDIARATGQSGRQVSGYDHPNSFVCHEPGVRTIDPNYVWSGFTDLEYHRVMMVADGRIERIGSHGIKTYEVRECTSCRSSCERGYLLRSRPLTHVGAGSF